MSKKTKRGRKPYCYTDYPIFGLGDIDGEKAPIRMVFPIMYDGDKMACVIVPGPDEQHFTAWIKWGYLYEKPRRLPKPNVKNHRKHRYDVRHLEVDFATFMSITPDQSS